MKGGFGNQLFQLCFANYLKSQNFKVKINTDLFSMLNSDTPRELTLPLKHFGFSEENKFSKFLFNNFLRLNSSKTAKKLFIGNILDNYRFTKESDNIANSNSKRFFFNGYWKDMKYIESNKKWLIDSLSKNKTIKKQFNIDLNENHAMIHVRRGDFLKDDRHLNVSYYEKSIDLLKQKNNKLRFDIFTDDEQWVKNQKIFNIAENIFGQKGGKNDDLNNPGIDGKDDNEETIFTFTQMLNYKHFISGNSSYAFWAAFIRSKDTSLITVPEPWFRNSNHPTLKLDNWYIVENI